MMTATPADLMIVDLRAELKDTLNIVHFGGPGPSPKNEHCLGCHPGSLYKVFNFKGTIFI